MTLSMRGITKAFDAHQALKTVDFSLREGEIRALIGENGAGKTTLMNILGGVLYPDQGTVSVGGKAVRFASPADSLAAGIAFIHQELNLVNDLALYENLYLGRELKKKNGLLDHAAMCRGAAEVLRRMGIALDPRAMVRDLDASYKQVAEIARALLTRAGIIIMDEPTTSLTDVEIDRVFQMMRQVAAQGVSIVFISHKLGEVLSVCDTFTVLRDGAVVAEGQTRGITEQDLAFHMVGHAIARQTARSGRAPGAPALRVRGLTYGRAFRNIDFTLRKGEILGFTGLLGDGRSELFRAIFAGAKGLRGEVFLDEKPVRTFSTSLSLRRGMGYVPRNRKENGIIKDMSIRENLTLVTLPRLKRHGLVDRKKEDALCREQIAALRVKAENVSFPIGSLSGGNQQKVVLGKWLAAKPTLMILDNPTQGVDVGAKEEIYELIGALAAQGVAVAVLSSEAQEILRIAGRALVMYHGEIRGELSGEDLTEHNIMLLATGGSRVGRSAQTEEEQP